MVLAAQQLAADLSFQTRIHQPPLLDPNSSSTAYVAFCADDVTRYLGKSLGSTYRYYHCSFFSSDLLSQESLHNLNGASKLAALLRDREITQF